MNDRSKTGLEILQIGIGLGILGDILLRETPWGLNVLMFNLVFAAALVTLLIRRKRQFLTPQTWALIGSQVFFAAMFVWRDAIELRVADSVAIVAILSVLFVPKLKVPARVAGAFHYIVGFLWSSLNAAFASAVLLTSDIEWKDSNRSVWAKHLISVARGVLIALPLVLIFGGLFMAADLAYEQMVQRAFNINFETIFTHTILFSVFAWASAGYLRGIMLGFEPESTVDPAEDSTPSESSGASKVDDLRNEAIDNPAALPGDATILEHINRSDPPNAPDASKTDPRKWDWAKIDNTLLPSAFSLGTVEIGVVLGLVNLLFLSFVIVQLPYLFGGMELVQNTPDFKLSEYARRGFGELVAVSAIVLPVLLVGHWLIRKESSAAEKLFRVLAAINIVLLFVIMASAVHRLVLLTGNLGYGLTTVRLYPLIFMVWLATVFLWFSLTVLRGARQYFAWGALWSAFFVLAATHVLNPDEFIVRTNVRLMREGRDFDARYNAQLSQDATAALIDSYDVLDKDAQCIVKERLNRETAAQTDDLRTWNWSRSQGQRSSAEKLDAIGRELRGCPSPIGVPYMP